MTMEVQGDDMGAVAAGRGAMSKLAAWWRRVDFSSAFWPAVVMGLMLAACKGVHIRPGWVLSWDYASWYVGNLSIAIHADLFYALCVGLLGQGMLWVVGRWRRVQAGVWLGYVLFCAVSVLYGVVSAQVFWFLRMPLTYALIYLAGDVKNMQSSVGAFVTPALVLAMVGMPLAYVGIVFWLSGVRVPGTRRWWIARGVGLVVLLVFVGACHVAAGGEWKKLHDNRRVAESPHWTFLSSCVVELLGGRGVHLEEEFPAGDMEDFRFVRERADGGAPTAGLKRGPRNVIVVVLESVATQHMQLYGSRYKTTPRLEAEAGNCLVFENVYAHFTNTANALAAMMLSVYPPMTWREITVENPGMAGETAAEVLKGRGYRTAFISGGDNAFANQSGFLIGRGFDTIWDCTNAGRARDFSWGVEDRYMMDMVLRWIDEEPGKPFFVFSWTQGTHNPYLMPAGQPEIDFFAEVGLRPAQADTAGWKLSRFLNALHETDRQLGRLFDSLRERKLAEETIVVIIGDHGEVFGYPHANWGHTGKVYQEDVNVPLIIWNPKLFSPGRRVETIGGHVDLNSTIMDLLGLPGAGSWQGWSLFDGAKPPRAYFYGAMENLLLAVREGNWKYTLNVTEGREELYELGTDPQEQRNVAGQERERCGRLRQRLAAWVDYQKRHVR